MNTITTAENTNVETSVVAVEIPVIETVDQEIAAEGANTPVVSTEAFKAMLAGSKKTTRKSASKTTDATAAKEAATMPTTTKHVTVKIAKNDLPVPQSKKGGVIVSELPTVPSGALVTDSIGLLPGFSREQILAAAKAIKTAEKAAPKATTKREAKTYDVTLTGVEAICPEFKDGVTTFATYAGHYDRFNAASAAVKAKGVRLMGNYKSGQYVGVHEDKVVCIDFQKPVGDKSRKA